MEAKVLYRVHKIRCLSLPSAKWIQSTPSKPIYFKVRLILSARIHDNEAGSVHMLQISRINYSVTKKVDPSSKVADSVREATGSYLDRQADFLA
jgi:hypothetical protein